MMKRVGSFRIGGIMKCQKSNNFVRLFSVFIVIICIATSLICNKCAFSNLVLAEEAQLSEEQLFVFGQLVVYEREYRIDNPDCTPEEMISYLEDKLDYLTEAYNDGIMLVACN